MRRIVRFGLLLLACSLVFDAASPRAALARKRKSVEATDASHRFFSFEEAPYLTSPDMRIGVKMLIDPARVGPSLASMQHLTYLPQAHVKSHRHVYGIEVLYILKGNLTVRIDQEIKVMGPNTTAYIPQQTFHEYMNKGQDVCEFLQYFSPSGPEEEYRGWQRANEEPAKAEPVKAVATTPQEIVRGARPAIPGSPDTHIDSEVKEVSDSASEGAPMGTTTPAALPDLKLRGESHPNLGVPGQAKKPAVTLVPPTSLSKKDVSLRVGQALSPLAVPPSPPASGTSVLKKPAPQGKSTAAPAAQGKGN